MVEERAEKGSANVEGQSAVLKLGSPAVRPRKGRAREDHLKASRASVVLHAPLGTLQFDPKEFWHHVEAFEMSDAQKQELLECVWKIMSSFVAWNFASTTTAFMLEAESPDMVPSDHSTNLVQETHAIGVQERIREVDERQ